MSRFYITKIAASGEKVEYSSVPFKDGVNFIEGPSNTGKSMLLAVLTSCLPGKRYLFQKMIPVTTLSCWKWSLTMVIHLRLKER